MPDFKDYNHSIIQLAVSALTLLFAFVACTHEDNDNGESKCPAGAVDLGIVMTREDGTTYNLYWAKSNLCESGLCANPEDYGDYYAWGETVPYYTEGHSQDNPCSDWRSCANHENPGYNFLSYKWWDVSYSALTKYCNERSYGITVDNITELQRGEKEGETMDDAARAKLGGKWRMPTNAEWAALLEQCTWTWTKQNGVNGILITASNGNSIFIPAAGYRYLTNLCDMGSNGCCWSSSLYADYPRKAWSVFFDSYDVCRYDGFRFYGLSVRPVSE